MEKTKLEKIKHALEFYLSTDSLKYLPRSGWILWGVKGEHKENVAEHTFSTQMLALAIFSEFHPNVDIGKVIIMLSLHETGEPIIGDIPLVHELKAFKKGMEHEAVEAQTSDLQAKNFIDSIIAEFEEGKTEEAKYAHWIDHLQCDIESKIIDEDNLVDLDDQDNNPAAKVDLVIKLLEEEKSFSGMWMKYGRLTYNYPSEMNELSEYAQHNNLHELRSNKIESAKAKVKAYLEKIQNKK